MDDLNLSGGLVLTVETVDDPPPPSDPDADAEKDAQESRISVATALATGVTVLAAALGVFGGLTGAVARMARNYPEWTAAAVSAVVLSVALAIMARLAAPGRGNKKVGVLERLVRDNERAPYWSTWLLWLSGVLFAAGVIGAVVLLAKTIDKDDRPSVSGVTTRDSSKVVTLAGTAKASGLSAEDAVRVVVMSFTEGETESGTQVYYAVVGPDADGLVDHSFTVILPADARAVVITAGSDASQPGAAEKVCKPAKGVDEPATEAAPLVGTDESLTACALLSIPGATSAPPEQKPEEKKPEQKPEDKKPVQKPEGKKKPNARR